MTRWFSVFLVLATAAALAVFSGLALSALRVASVWAPM